MIQKALMEKRLKFGSYQNFPILNDLSNDKRYPWVLRSFIRTAWRNRKADVELAGIKFRVCPHLNSHDMSIARGRFFDAEREEMTFMQERLSKGGILLDIGANIGAISIPLAVRTACRVLAIEPDPENIARLSYNVAINGLEDFEIVQSAVGPLDTLTLWRYPGNSGMNSIHRSRKSSKSITVACKTLLRILQESGIDRIDVLKIDIEGFEDEALCPFFRHAPRSLCPKAVNIEHTSSSHWKENCIALMQGLGYEIKMRTQTNTLMILTSETSRANL